MGKILLFHVNFMKVNQIQCLCTRLQHTVQLVEKQDYGKTLGALAGISGIKKEGIYKGAEFEKEMMVFSGMTKEDVERFLDAYKQASIAPIPRKAILTPSNVMWSAQKLYTELNKHIG